MKISIAVNGVGQRFCNETDESLKRKIEEMKREVLEEIVFSVVKNIGLGEVEVVILWILEKNGVVENEQKSK